MGLINYLGNIKIIKEICQLLKVTDVQDGEGHSLVDENGIAIVSGGGGGSSTLAGLTDVDVTGASDGDVLALNGTSGKWEDIALANVAKSGSYNDLSNKPTALSSFTNDQGFITNSVNNLTNYYTKTQVDALIPTVNDATLTIKNGSVSKGTFSANASSNANITVLPFDITGNEADGYNITYPS